MSALNKDRWDANETPESADERESEREARFQRHLDRADYIRDEMRDRKLEQDRKEDA